MSWINIDSFQIKQDLAMSIRLDTSVCYIYNQINSNEVDFSKRFTYSALTLSKAS